ncbi:hypothetical protein EW146_g5451 [Bondarzewia mesenterica]|uniref:Uncharacterized protein n=1 Tax=Bondarzewia mesenterica TaxID=1095465 RepID=A0A4S4LRH1_9AGAM|nr:hypothetical protein EW146_g5451 [Bondarzewia mesenterica]
MSQVLQSAPLPLAVPPPPQQLCEYCGADLLTINPKYHRRTCKTKQTECRFPRNETGQDGLVTTVVDVLTIHRARDGLFHCPRCHTNTNDSDSMRRHAGRCFPRSDAPSEDEEEDPSPPSPSVAGLSPPPPVPSHLSPVLTEPHALLSPLHLPSTQVAVASVTAALLPAPKFVGKRPAGHSLAGPSGPKRLKLAVRTSSATMSTGSGGSQVSAAPARRPAMMMPSTILHTVPPDMETEEVEPSSTMTAVLPSTDDIELGSSPTVESGYPFNRTEDARLEILHRVVVALETVCPCCWAIDSMVQSHPLNLCEGRLATHSDDAWRTWRRDNLRFEANRSCYGCGMGINLSYIDESLRVVPFRHDGGVSMTCVWLETIRPLSYVVFTNPDLYQHFLNSTFSDGYSPSNPLHSIAQWLRHYQSGSRIPNYLRVVEFVVALREVSRVKSACFSRVSPLSLDRNNTLTMTSVAPQDFSRTIVSDGQDVYLALNIYGLPTPGGRQLDETSDIELDVVGLVRWASERYPQFAFIPLLRPFQGRIFSRLDISFKNFPIEQTHDRRYILGAPARSGWIRLESALVGIIKMLSGWKPQLYHLDTSYYPLPSTFGYTLEHTSSKGVRLSADRARHAFVVLMASVSHMIYLVSKPHELSLPYAPWMHHLVTHCRLHPQWVADLRQSPVGDFSQLRLGAFIHPSISWLQDVDGLLAAKVPLWILYDRDHPIFNRRDHPIAKYAPTADEVDVAIAGARADELYPVEPISPWDLVEYRPVQPGSGQLPSENITEFFQRREIANALRIEVETFSELARRVDHDLAARTATQPAPHSLVYEWVDIGDFFVRVRVERGQIPQVWAKYTPDQRWYDSLRNQWDLTTAFDPSAQDETEDDEAIVLPPQEPPRTLSQLASLPLVPPTHYHDDLAAILLASTVQHLDMARSSTPETIQEILQMRYGFAWTGMGYASLAVTGKRPASLDWSRCQAILVQRGATMPTSLQQPVADFIESFLACGPTAAPSISHRLWDLNETLSSPLVFRIRRIYQRERTLFVFMPLPDHVVKPRWHLVVESAATVIQSIRAGWGPDLPGLARELLDRGIAFNTRVLDARLPTGPPSYPPFITLGWRLPGYQPDAVDYAHYEATRDAFLAHPRARAALLQGGILWRLALHAVGFGAVIVGPTDTVFEAGKAVLASPTMAAWDDDLSQGEMEVISGVYRVFTGNSMDMAEMSWWPQHKTWCESGLDVGYWSSLCEDWFQNRLSQIRDNWATLRSAREWRSSLRFRSKETRQLEDANERAARNYLLRPEFK